MKRRVRNGSDVSGGNGAKRELAVQVLTFQTLTPWS